MKNTVCGILLGALTLVLLGAGFGCDESAVAYKKISAAGAKAFMDSGEPYVLLDVRTEEEFKERHIRGAILIPHTEIKNRAASDLPDVNALVLVYCRSGRRSAITAKELIRSGYTRVYDFGGIIDWPYGTVPGSAEPRQ